MAVDLLSTEVVAVIVAVAGGEGGNEPEPRVLTVGAATGVPALPSGPLLAGHRSLQAGLRDWVESQTGLRMGYVEQLYTFADRERTGSHTRVISVSYLGLTRPEYLEPDGATWRAWYDLLPWEDRRFAVPPGADVVQSGLTAWAGAAATEELAEQRRLRADRAFGDSGRAWHPEDCLKRYELLWEADLLAESRTARRPIGSPRSATGERMLHDHRRIAATGLTRLRAKIQYRPVVFELLPDAFTLGQLQQVVEALSGTRLHKQNFRRLVETEELVEETGETTSATGGRPARLMRFRTDTFAERSGAGLRLPQSRPR